VESRSGKVGEDSAAPTLKGARAALSYRRPGQPSDSDGAEVTVHLKVGYKTVLLVVVVFDLVHLSVRELFNSSFIEQLLGIG